MRQLRKFLLMKIMIAKICLRKLDIRRRKSLRQNRWQQKHSLRQNRSELGTMQMQVRRRARTVRLERIMWEYWGSYSSVVALIARLICLFFEMSSLRIIWKLQWIVIWMKDKIVLVELVVMELNWLLMKRGVLVFGKWLYWKKKHVQKRVAKKSELKSYK